MEPRLKQDSPLFNPYRSLQAAQQELARQKAADDLKKNLEKRLDRDTLVERMYTHIPSIPSIRHMYSVYHEGSPCKSNHV